MRSLQPGIGGSWHACGIVAVVLLGCSGRTAQAPSVALPQFAALSGLSEVRLGMTVAELRAIRPRIVSAPFAGARETIGSDTVWYLLDRLTPRERDPGRDQLAQLPDARVVGVASSRVVRTVQSGDSLARDWVSRLGTPTECFRHHYRDVVNDVAVFRQQQRAVYVTRRPPSTFARDTGAISLAGGVQLLIAAPDSRAVPRAPRAERVDCGQLFASRPASNTPSLR